MADPAAPVANPPKTTVEPTAAVADSAEANVEPTATEAAASTMRTRIVGLGS